MFNAVIITIWLTMSIIAIAVHPMLGIATILPLLIFLSVKLLKKQCVFLIGEDDCQIWDIYSKKEMDFCEDSLWTGAIRKEEK